MQPASPEVVMALAQAALAAADPWTLVREQLSLADDTMNIASLELDADLYREYLRDRRRQGGSADGRRRRRRLGRPHHRRTGCRQGRLSTCRTSRIEIIEAAHPVPDARAAAGARRIFDLVGRAGEQDLVICLISGGGSALLTLPCGATDAEEIQQTTTALLRSGAPIGEVNAVRKHLTLASGGRLAMAAAPRLWSHLLSLT